MSFSNAGLPFLKQKKFPRIAKPMEEKSIGFSPQEQLEDHCIDEMMMACAQKDVNAFRKALEALVMDQFEGEEDAA